MRPTTGLLSYGPFERAMWLWGRDGLVLGGLPDPMKQNGPTRFLDVGCGSGMLAITAAQMGFDVTAIDMSERMIERVKTNVALEVPGIQVAAFVEDGQKLEKIKDHTMDVVSSTFGIAIFPDRLAGWAAAKRVLVPGGRLVATSWSTDSANYGMFGYLLANAADDTTSSASPTKPYAPNRTTQADSFRDELEESGFTDVRVHTVSNPFCFASGQEFVEDVIGSGWAASVLPHKETTSVQRALLDYAQLLLDGEDPFASDVSSKILVASEVPAENHPLWTTPFLLKGLGFIAIATKP